MSARAIRAHTAAPFVSHGKYTPARLTTERLNLSLRPHEEGAAHAEIVEEGKDRLLFLRTKTWRTGDAERVDVLAGQSRSLLWQLEARRAERDVPIRQRRDGTEELRTTVRLCPGEDVRRRDAFDRQDLGDGKLGGEQLCLVKYADKSSRNRIELTLCEWHPPQTAPRMEVLLEAEAIANEIGITFRIMQASKAMAVMRRARGADVSSAQLEEGVDLTLAVAVLCAVDQLLFDTATTDYAVNRPDNEGCLLS